MKCAVSYPWFIECHLITLQVSGSHQAYEKYVKASKLAYYFHVASYHLSHEYSRITVLCLDNMKLDHVLGSCIVEVVYMVKVVTIWVHNLH